MKWLTNKLIAAIYICTKDSTSDFPMFIKRLTCFSSQRKTMSVLSEEHGLVIFGERGSDVCCQLGCVY